ncbi:MAG: hypothetical protein M1457_10995, partial [bacterium]|nr:hypothetical protein [bacterium]
ACPGWSDLDTTQTLATVSRLSTWLADSVFGRPMTDHEFVGGNLYHERTEFDSAQGPTTVIVNTALEPWSPRPGLTLPPLGFFITGPRLMAYYATEVAGHRFSRPTLVAFNAAGGVKDRRMAYRAFGDDAAILMRDSKPVLITIPTACRTQRVAQP